MRFFTMAIVFCRINLKNDMKKTNQPRDTGSKQLLVRRSAAIVSCSQICLKSIFYNSNCFVFFLLLTFFFLIYRGFFCLFLYCFLLFCPFACISFHDPSFHILRHFPSACVFLWFFWRFQCVFCRGAHLFSPVTVFIYPSCPA